MKLQDEFQDLTCSPDKENSVPWNGKMSRRATVDSGVKDYGMLGVATRSLRLNLRQIQLGEHLDSKRFFLPYAPVFMDLKLCNTYYVHKSVGGFILNKECRTRSRVWTYGEFTDEEISEELFFLKRCDLIKSFEVMPKVILEPLKGRIITCPSSGDYIHYNYYQEFLWERLRKHRSFELMGRPVETEDIYYISDNMKDNEVYVSGDYSGATDNLSGDLSQLIIRWLFRKTSKKFLDNLVRSFCSSDIDYTLCPVQQSTTPWPVIADNFKSCELGVMKQRNGQLMGHVLSFIVLCLANYLVFCYSFWQSFEDLEIPRVLINGDDILFKCDESHVGTWMDCVRSVGFFPSMGKNLVNRDICQINSVLFKTEYDNVGGWFGLPDRNYVRRIIPIEYINFGILTGRGKGKDTGRRESQTESMNLSSDLCNILPTFWSDLRAMMFVTQSPINKEIVKERYIKNRPVLDRFWRDSYWDLPEIYFKHSVTQEIDTEDSTNLFADISSLGIARRELISKLNFLKALTSKSFSGIASILPHGLVTIPTSVLGTWSIVEETTFIGQRNRDVNIQAVKRHLKSWTDQGHVHRLGSHDCMYCDLDFEEIDSYFTTIGETIEDQWHGSQD
jgi:hypothetical protein